MFDIRSLCGYQGSVIRELLQQIQSESSKKSIE